MIRIENLSKSFEVDGEKIWAIKDVNLHIKPGEIFGIIGESGAGKSTLLRTINRLEEADTGHIFIEGENINILNKKSLRNKRKNIGMIFQGFNLLSQKTVYDNIGFPLELEGLKKDEINLKVETLLDYIDLMDKRNAYPSQLSGGQKQRVAIARALANEPKILLSDEATSALDPKTTKSILKLLDNARKEFNLTIVLITHQMEVIKDICDKVAIMENGQIVEINTPVELFRDPKTNTARNLINSLKPDVEEEFINTGNFSGQIIRLSFLGSSAKKPIVSKMVKNFNIEVNILSGNINELMSTSVGHLILELLGKDEDVNSAINYLKSQNVNVEVI